MSKKSIWDTLSEKKKLQGDFEYLNYLKDAMETKNEGYGAKHKALTDFLLKAVLNQPDFKNIDVGEKSVIEKVKALSI